MDEKGAISVTMCREKSPFFIRRELVVKGCMLKQTSRFLTLFVVVEVFDDEFGDEFRILIIQTVAVFRQ